MEYEFVKNRETHIKDDSYGEQDCRYDSHNVYRNDDDWYEAGFHYVGRRTYSKPNMLKNIASLRELFG